MTSRLAILASVLISAGLCVGVAGCTQGPPPSQQPPPSRVTVSHPVVHSVSDYADFTGQTLAVNTVEVRARVWGYLDNVYFREGAIVNKGDVLYQIDSRPYRALLDQSKGKVAQDEATLKHNDATYRRLQQLRRTGAASQEDLDKALADRDSIAATLQADKGDQEQKQLDLDFTRISSPITGRISRTEVTEGNVVQSGQNGGTLLTTIVSVDPMYVYFDVDERSLLQVRRLMHDTDVTASNATVKVKMGLADEDDYPHEGTVNFVDNRVDASTGTLRLRGVFPNADALLSPGLFVHVRLPIGTPHPAVLIPEQALGSDQGQKFVYIVDDKNEVSYRAVKTGRLYGGLRVVTDGLAKNDTVVVNGLQRVRPGSKVEPKMAPVPAEPKLAESGSQPKKPAAGN